MIKVKFMALFKFPLPFILLFIPMLSLPACAPRPQPVDPGEARRIVFQAVTGSQSPQTAASYTVLGSQAGFDGHVVAYWMCRPTGPNSPAAAVAGFAIVRRYSGHSGIQMMSSSEAGLPRVDALLEYVANVEWTSDMKLKMVYGRILSPEVQAVELEYADHQSLRWPAGSGGFLLFRNEPVDWVRLNALGANDQVLKSYDLTGGTTIISDRDEDWKQDCPTIQ